MFVYLIILNIGRVVFFQLRCVICILNLKEIKGVSDPYAIIAKKDVICNLWIWLLIHYVCVELTPRHSNFLGLFGCISCIILFKILRGRRKMPLTISAHFGIRSSIAKKHVLSSKQLSSFHCKKYFSSYFYSNSGWYACLAKLPCRFLFSCLTCAHD